MSWMKPPRGWRKHRKLSEADNLGLPVPRLEIRYSPCGESTAALYSLVYLHLLGHIAQIPLGLTMCGGNRVREPDYLDLPFREGAHIISDMLELGLPGYVINGDKSQAIAPDKASLPSGVVNRLKYRLSETERQ